MSGLDKEREKVVAYRIVSEKEISELPSCRENPVWLGISLSLGESYIWTIFGASIKVVGLALDRGIHHFYISWIGLNFKGCPTVEALNNFSAEASTSSAGSQAPGTFSSLLWTWLFLGGIFIQQPLVPDSESIHFRTYTSNRPLKWAGFLPFLLLRYFTD